MEIKHRSRNNCRLVKVAIPLRGCEKMGLAPSRSRKNSGILLDREVPVPILSQPLRGMISKRHWTVMVWSHLDLGPQEGQSLGSAFIIPVGRRALRSPGWQDPIFFPDFGGQLSAVRSTLISSRTVEAYPLGRHRKAEKPWSEQALDTAGGDAQRVSALLLQSRSGGTGVSTHHRANTAR